MAEQRDHKARGKSMGKETSDASKVPISCCLPVTVDSGRDHACHIGRSTTTKRPTRAVNLPGGRVRVGTDIPLLTADGEGPSRLVRLRPFTIDPFAVTNEYFGLFVEATGYRTEAERIGWSAVFFDFVLETARGVPSAAGASWWRKTLGADWRHPEGPASSIAGRFDHPVVHVSYNDAQAFADWAGGRLPTEAEWEYAAQGGIQEAKFPWGNREPDETEFLPCNIWQGTFPAQNTLADGYAGTAPVTAFAPNCFGLYNMIGNTWEWCKDSFRIASLARAAKERNAIARETGQRVAKGGSYLCHRSYCYRYRIAARIGAPPDTATGHLGFRIVWDLP
jgi:formylglycine-generating enzyme